MLTAATKNRSNGSVSTVLGSTPHHLLSDVSTVIATVQQPRRGAQITPVEKPATQSRNPFPASRGDGPTQLTDNTVHLSTLATVLPSVRPLNAPELRASRDLMQARDSTGRVSGRNVSGRSSSSAGDRSSSDVGDASASDLLKTGGELASRNGPLRRRVLKPIYDD